MDMTDDGAQSDLDAVYGSADHGEAYGEDERHVTVDDDENVAPSEYVSDEEAPASDVPEWAASKLGPAEHGSPEEKWQWLEKKWSWLKAHLEFEKQRAELTTKQALDHNAKDKRETDFLYHAMGDKYKMLRKKISDHVKAIVNRKFQYLKLLYAKRRLSLMKKHFAKLSKHYKNLPAENFMKRAWMRYLKSTRHKYDEQNDKYHESCKQAKKYLKDMNKWVEAHREKMRALRRKTRMELHSKQAALFSRAEREHMRRAVRQKVRAERKKLDEIKTFWMSKIASGKLPTTSKDKRAMLEKAKLDHQQWWMHFRTKLEAGAGKSKRSPLIAKQKKAFLSKLKTQKEFAHAEVDNNTFKAHTGHLMTDTEKEEDAKRKAAALAAAAKKNKGRLHGLTVDHGWMDPIKDRAEEQRTAVQRAKAEKAKEARKAAQKAKVMKGLGFGY